MIQSKRLCQGNPRPPHRHEIAGAVVEVLRRSPPYKADILVVDLGEGPVVIKDFIAKPWWGRLLGRIQIGRECRAYQWLGPMPCVPAFLGRIDALAFAMVKVDGGYLTDADDRFSARKTHLKHLRSVLDRFSAAGFVHLDFRARRNVLVRPDGEVVVVDLAGSVWFRPGSLRYRLFKGWIRWFHRAALLKWKELLTPGRSSRNKRSLLGNLWLKLRMPHRWRSTTKRSSDSKADECTFSAE